MLISTDDQRSLSQIYFEETEELKQQGLSNAEAIREVAERYGKTEQAVRGGIHTYKTNHKVGSAAVAPTNTVEDLVEAAERALTNALEMVDHEIDQAASALAAAQERYDELQRTGPTKKKDIERKLLALRGSQPEG